MVLDQLATGVAVFNIDRKLTFYNAAFRSLFELDSGLLDQTPTDAAVLDILRDKRKLPEEQNFREWRQELYEAYRRSRAERTYTGICRMDEPCASSPRQIRKVA